MKKQKAFISILLTLACIAAFMSFAYAGTSTSGSRISTASGDLLERISAAPEFKFWNNDYGIGYGKCPVYTAPSTDAYRCADGKASCDTNAKMSDGGFDVTGWLLVRYDTNNGGCRVGYIPPQYVKGFRTQMPTPEFDYIPVTAVGTVYVTDNPLLSGSYFAILDDAETFYVLGKYTYYGDWWYIECTVDGQIARGFVDRGTTTFNVDGSPYVAVNPGTSPIGTTQNGEVLIQSDTNTKVNARKQADPDSELIGAVYVGRRYPCYGEKMGTTGKIWYYIWIEELSSWGWVSSSFGTVYY